MKYLKYYENFAPVKRYEISDYYNRTFKGKYIENEYTNIDFNKIIEILERDCSKFLSELKDKEQNPIFRGYRKIIGSEIIDGIYKKTARTDRRAKDMNVGISEDLDNRFKEKFGIYLRSSGVFATKNPDTSDDYGTSYMFFPIGDYKYYANLAIRDLYSTVYDSLLNDREIEAQWEYKYNKIDDSDGEFVRDEEGNSKWIPAVTLEDFIVLKKQEQEQKIVDMINGYETGLIDQLSEQEMTFICHEYYLVETAFYFKMCDYLKGETQS